MLPIFTNKRLLAHKYSILSNILQLANNKDFITKTKKIVSTLYPEAIAITTETVFLYDVIALSLHRNQ